LCGSSFCCQIGALFVSFTLSPAEEDAVEKLLDLSPYDLKHLLHLIFSSKEFTVDESKELELELLG